MKILLSEPDRHWLAGLLEGEGSFVWHQTKRDKGRPRIQLAMTDSDVVERASKIMRSSFTGPYGPYTTQKLPAWYAHCSGELAYTLMKQIYPLLGIRRQGQIKPLMEKYENLVGGH